MYVWAMKNEERILELLAETLQRIDRHNAEIERIWKRLESSDQKTDRHIVLIEQQGERIERQQDEIDILIGEIQKHQERLDRHGEAFGALRDRTEQMHQSALEQQKAYQAMTELLMHHNRALVARGII